MERTEKEHTARAPQAHTPRAPARRGPRNTQNTCVVFTSKTRSSPPASASRAPAPPPPAPCLSLILLPYALLVCVLLEEYTLHSTSLTLYLCVYSSRSIPYTRPLFSNLDRRAYAPGCQHSIELATTPLGTAGLFGVAETALGRRAGE